MWPSNNTLSGLEELGVDLEAISKLMELGTLDLQKLLAQFFQMNNAGQIKDPSRWLYSKARTIAANLSRMQHQQQKDLQPFGKACNRKTAVVESQSKNPRTPLANPGNWPTK